MDDLAWMRLQLEWGVDEALLEQVADRRARPAPPLSAMPAPAVIGLPSLETARSLAAAASSVVELRAALAGFEGCALRATATNLVFSDGNPDARLVVVADVPGAAEDRAGKPLAGPAALFLDRMLASAGLDRADWLTTSLLPWRPPGDRKPADVEVQVCLPFILRHLALVRPRWVVLLGGLAVRTLLPLSSGRRSRGIWHQMTVPGLPSAIPTLALPSPSHILSSPSAKRDGWSDVLRLRRAIDSAQEDHK